MDEKVPEIPVELEHTQVLRERLTPGKVANFPGSPVANHLGHTLGITSYPQNKGELANWVAYFTEGWDDPGIWKSVLCYLSGMIDTTITSFGTPQAPAYAGVVSTFL